MLTVGLKRNVQGGRGKSGQGNNGLCQLTGRGGGGVGERAEEDAEVHVQVAVRTLCREENTRC